jgi:hypothetical protein
LRFSSSNYLFFDPNFLDRLPLTTFFFVYAVAVDQYEAAGAMITTCDPIAAGANPLT